jgi:Tfp pilus assembly protein PilN
MKLRLNLATTPLENNRRFLVGYGLAGGVAFLLLLILSVQTYRTWRASHDLRADVARSEDQIHNFTRAQADLEAYFKLPVTRQVLDRAAFLNSLIEQRSFPWTKIFSDLEQILPPGVRVISIAPRMQGGKVEVKLLIGAASDDGILKFLKALESSPVFSGMQVKQGSHPTQASAGDRVLVELVAWYQTT